MDDKDTTRSVEECSIQDDAGRHIDSLTPEERLAETLPWSDAAEAMRRMPREERLPRFTPPRSNRNTLYCSFCGKSQHEVRKLIAGPTVFICDECVGLCNEIFLEEGGVIGTLSGIHALVQNDWAVDVGAHAALKDGIARTDVSPILSYCLPKLEASLAGLRTIDNETSETRQEAAASIVACLIPLLQLAAFSNISSDEILDEIRKWVFKQRV